MPCESPWVRNIYLQYWFQLFAIHRNGSLDNAALELRGSSLLKSLSAINLNQMTIKSLVFRLTGSTTIASAFAISKERSNLQWNCPMTSQRKIIVSRDTADSFVKVSFWFPKGNTLQQRSSVRRNKMLWQQKTNTATRSWQISSWKQNTNAKK